MPKSMFWLSVVALGLVSASALGQPTPSADVPLTAPAIAPVPAVEMPGVQPPNVVNDAAFMTEMRAAASQAEMAQWQEAQRMSDAAGWQFLQTQLMAQTQLQNEALRERAMQERERAMAAEDELDAAEEEARTAVEEELETSRGALAMGEERLADFDREDVETAERLPFTLAAPEALDARGANLGANLRWRLPSGARAERYVLYCDDGTLAASSEQRTVLASDECPSHVALVAGAPPAAGWSVCAELEGSRDSVELTGLENGHPYAFALAARDETGVVGALSSVSCAIPSANGEYEFDEPTAATADALTTAEDCAFSPLGLRTEAKMPLLTGALVMMLALARRRAGRVR